MAPARKTDPGELFAWRDLAQAGIGLWPHAAAAAPKGRAFRPGDADATVTAVQRQLGAYGYALDATGVLDDATATVLTAFQRHFRPANIDGALDPETAGLVAAVLAAAEGAKIA